MLEILILLASILVIIWLVYQASSYSGQQQEPFSEGQTTNYQTAYKKEAQSETALKEQIQNLPQAKVKYIIDGDTVIVAKRWSEIKIRLDSIDCPENGQHWGDIAKYGLIKLIGRQSVYLEEHGIDKHGRTLATIYIWHEQKSDWLNVNERMVTLGHAWVMRRFYDHLPQDRQDKLNRLERWARSKKVGLWSTSDSTPPWKWRSDNGCSPLE